MKQNPKSTKLGRNFYGRIKGKALRPQQLRDIDELVPKLQLERVTFEENPDRTPLKPLNRFSGHSETWLEIGFGGGEHMVHQASENPNVGIIGCEPYVNGVAMALGKIRAAGVNNIALHMGDARDLMDVLPEASIDKAFLLYPDPWPKARHHRRRFVTPEHLEPLRACLKTGAEFRIATDIEDYVRQSLQEVPKVGFEWLAKAPADWCDPWGDWVSTRYEQKALREGRKPHYLTFRAM
ncbi:MAG: tRNA (guanine(46)-N(7))-methyltransferase TrmB [Pseudomonadota bacterium]